jgi:hypothetical protein
LTVNKRSALGDSPVFLGNPRGLDRFGLKCTVTNTGAREVKLAGVDAHERGRALIVDTTPVQSESTASVEPVGEIKKAITPKLEALEPRV